MIFIRYMEENPRAGLQDDESDVEVEYDEDGNPLAPKKSKVSVENSFYWVMCSSQMKNTYK